MAVMTMVMPVVTMVAMMTMVMAVMVPVVVAVVVTVVVSVMVTVSMPKSKELGTWHGQGKCHHCGKDCEDQCLNIQNPEISRR
jgi:hypothetical protein